MSPSPRIPIRDVRFRGPNWKFQSGTAKLVLQDLDSKWVRLFLTVLVRRSLSLIKLISIQKQEEEFDEIKKLKKVLIAEKHILVEAEGRSDYLTITSRKGRF